jgi:purine-cytosine permease-like protein
MLVIFFTNVFTAMLPAYMATFGPALGLRQMTSARCVSSRNLSRTLADPRF